MVVFQIDEVTVYFPYDFIYPEQYAYIRALKQTLDAKGHAVLEMPTGTGKTVALLSLLTSYQLAHPRLGKILYCTRTVPEMEKALLELKGVIDYRISEIQKERERSKARQQQATLHASSPPGSCVASKDTCSSSPASTPQNCPSSVLPSGNKDNNSDKAQQCSQSNKKPRTAEEIQEQGCSSQAPISEGPSHSPVDGKKASDDGSGNTLPYVTKETTSAGYILGVGLSARRNMCINPTVSQQPDREKIDEGCRQLTAPWVRQKFLTTYNPPTAHGTSRSPAGGGSAGEGVEPPVDDIENVQSSSCSSGGCTAREALRRREALASNEESEPGLYSPSLCAWYENFDRYFAPQFFPAGVYTIEELKIAAAHWKHPILHRTLPFCPYFLARRLLHIANVVVLNYQYVLDPKVSQAALLVPAPDGASASHTVGGQTKMTYTNPYRGGGNNQGNLSSTEILYEGSVVVFDEAHNIDNVCIEALSVNINRSVMEGALRNLSQLAEKIEEVKKEDAQRLKEEYESLIRGLKRREDNADSRGNSGASTTSNDTLQGAQDKQAKTSSEKEANSGAEGTTRNQNDKSSEDTSGTTLRSSFSAGSSSSSATQTNRQRPQEAGGRRAAEDGGTGSSGRREGLLAAETLDLLATPLLPDDALMEQAVPGSIRKAEHFVALMRRIVAYLKSYIKIYELKSEGPLSFLHMFEKETQIDASLLKFFYDRLKSLFNTLQITEVESYTPLTLVADFCTLVATYCEGFILICDPYPEAVGLYDPLLQLSCLDASLAMQPVLKRFQSLILTSGTISPLELYPKLLNFVPVITESFPMSLDRNCICPLIVSRGSDQVPLTSKFEYRHDMNVLRNYSNLLIDLCKCVPDGLVCFFTSYSYMESVLSSWYHSGVLAQVLDYKLIFIETKDVVATTLALHNFRRACECGRGAVFFSVARGKVAEGIDFDRHFGRCVVLFGVPFQYTLSRVLKARLDFMREQYQIPDNEFLTFDAMRQAAQCVGRVIRSKSDYGLMIFADARYSRADKRSKLPPWILKHLDLAHLALNTDTAISVARTFLKLMSQPPPAPCASRLDARQLQQHQQQCWDLVRRSLHLSTTACLPVQPKNKAADTTEVSASSGSEAASSDTQETIKNEK
ncbi:dna excision repair helicase [Cystoisospora suis]|uniref:DNA 5'-3' helicase n=1 Tax=Cystoisospora suis TaxID=483139 RepID=A0A2C6KYQ6_9APIC|nr:dna excision repair helicase [Cystoisospora suis]